MILLQIIGKDILDSIVTYIRNIDLKNITIVIFKDQISNGAPIKHEAGPAGGVGTFLTSASE